MNIVRVFVGERQVAEYPDCNFYSMDRFIYVVPSSGKSHKDYVSCWPKACTNVSAVLEKQKDPVTK